MGRNVEAYVDDAIVESMTFSEHLLVLKETFQTLRHYKLKLNQKKMHLLYGGMQVPLIHDL